MDALDCRSLEVVRIYRGLLDEDASRPETEFSFYLDRAVKFNVEKVRHEDLAAMVGGAGAAGGAGGAPDEE